MYDKYVLRGTNVCFDSYLFEWNLFQTVVHWRLCIACVGCRAMCWTENWRNIRRCQVQLTANSLKVNWLNFEKFRILVTFHRITNDVHQMLICIYFKLSLFICCQYTDESFIYGLSNSLRVKLKTAFTWCHLMDPKWRDPRLLVVVTAPSHLNLTWGTAGAMPTRQSVSTSHLAAWWETMNGTHSGLCKWITN